MLNATEEERREFHEVFRVKTAGMEGPPLHLSVRGRGWESGGSCRYDVVGIWRGIAPHQDEG